MGQAVKPLEVQVEDNGSAVREMAKVITQFGRRLEDRLQAEGMHLEQRFKLHEEAMRQQAEGRLRHLTTRLDAMQRQMSEVYPSRASSASFDGALASLQASLKRIEDIFESLENTSWSSHLPASEQAKAAPRPAAGDSANPPHLLQTKSQACQVGTEAVLQEPTPQPCEHPAPEEERPQEQETRIAGPSAACASPVIVRATSRSPKERGCSSENTNFGDLSLSGSLNSSILPLTSLSQRRDGLHSMEQRMMFGMEYSELLHYHHASKTWLQRKASLCFLWFLEWWVTLREPPRTGWLAALVSSNLFEGLCAGVICANAGFLAYAANVNAERLSHEEDPYILAGEVIFLAWYAVEVALKMAVHRFYFFAGPDMRWNWLDIFLLVLAVCNFVSSLVLSTARGISSDATILRSLRVLKMAKILRVMRIMRVFNDLRLMLTSVIGSVVSLIWSFLMLAFVYFLFGLIFLQSMTEFLLQEGDNADPDLVRQVLLHFGSLGQAMLTLFKATSGGNDWDYYYDVIAKTGWGNSALFIFFIGFVQISLMNILTALFVERAMRLAQPDTITQAKEQRFKERCEAHELRRICMEMDSNQSGTVSADEFRRHIESSEMRCYLSVLGLDIRNAQEFFEMLVFISDGDEVDIETFVQGCLRMRGAASGVAQQNLMMEVRLLRRAQCELCQHFSTKMDELSRRLTQHSL